MTQNALGGRVVNFRIFRVAPSRAGHVGYTKRGFYLTKQEIKDLREALTDMLADDGLFEPVDTGMKEVSDTLVERDE